MATIQTLIQLTRTQKTIFPLQRSITNKRSYICRSEFIVGIFAWCSVIRIHTALFTPWNHSGRGYMSYNFMFVALSVNCGTRMIYLEQIIAALIHFLLMKLLRNTPTTPFSIYYTQSLNLCQLLLLWC